MPVNVDLRKILTIFLFGYFREKLLIQHGNIESNRGLSKKPDLWLAVIGI